MDALLRHPVFPPDVQLVTHLMNQEDLISMSRLVTFTILSKSDQFMLTKF